MNTPFFTTKDTKGTKDLRLMGLVTLMPLVIERFCYFSFTSNSLVLKQTPNQFISLYQLTNLRV